MLLQLQHRRRRRSRRPQALRVRLVVVVVAGVRRRKRAERGNDEADASLLWERLDFDLMRCMIRIFYLDARLLHEINDPEEWKHSLYFVDALGKNRA